MVGFSIFKIVGPFYITGLLCAETNWTLGVRFAGYIPGWNLAKKPDIVMKEHIYVDPMGNWCDTMTLANGYNEKNDVTQGFCWNFFNTTVFNICVIPWYKRRITIAVFWTDGSGIKQKNKDEKNPKYAEMANVCPSFSHLPNIQ
ncbi:hypothetical protein NECAME_17944 [Necator americanus]|uniref:Uncharacterized protein n=1 Tax=Necator americanus TaxID=51031 RepID=W2TJ65_NECAM|nr:hypothetical protein NECAME_17944 [Necator americanus]ETN81067.1 hypothetical protein NECAME_17944 [Necator americanus]